MEKGDWNYLRKLRESIKGPLDFAYDFSNVDLTRECSEINFPVSCYDCRQCYRTTMICEKFNKSVADNSVHPWECDGFGPRDTVR